MFVLQSDQYRTFVSEVSDGFEEDRMKNVCSRLKCKSLIVKSQRLLLVTRVKITSVQTKALLREIPLKMCMFQHSGSSVFDTSALTTSELMMGTFEGLVWTPIETGSVSTFTFSRVTPAAPPISSSDPFRTPLITRG